MRRIIVQDLKHMRTYVFDCYQVLWAPVQLHSDRVQGRPEISKCSGPINGLCCKIVARTLVKVAASTLCDDAANI
jgi:hypothetical protein